MKYPEDRDTISITKKSRVPIEPQGMKLENIISPSFIIIIIGIE
jgi:hypothetical protein